MAGSQYKAFQPKLPGKLNGKNAQIECELIWAFFLHVDEMLAAAIA